MADENIQEQEPIVDEAELGEEELDDIAGGYIHDNRNYGGDRYEVIDGKGNVVARFSDHSEAKNPHVRISRMSTADTLGSALTISDSHGYERPLVTEKSAGSARLGNRAI